MKKNHKFNALAGAMAVTLLSWAAPGNAGIFTWSAPVAITTADATLELGDTIVFAENFGGNETIVVLTDGTTIDFTSGGGGGGGGFTGDTGNPTFNAVLGVYNYGGTKMITLTNLIVGQQYSVQLFAVDDRSGESTKTLNYQDPSDASDISDTIMEGDNVYIIGTFTATNTTAVIQQNDLQSGAVNINALVLRALGVTLAPHITTQPQSATIYNGRTANFTVSAYGTGLLSYQWQAAPVGTGVFTNVIDNSRISGATTYSLIISNLATTDTADYRVVVTGSAGSVTSAPPATLTVLPGSPAYRYTWSAPVAITTADATLELGNVIVGAIAFGTTEKIVILTDGTTIDFKSKANGSSIATISGGGTGTGGFTGGTGNPTFDAILGTYTYTSGKQTITLQNLTVGQNYSVQLFCLDDRNGETTRTVNYQDPSDAYDVSATVAEGANVYVIGTFTASNTTAVIQQNVLHPGNANINALVVRAVGVIAPHITTQPQSATIYNGRTANFTVSAYGTGLLSYQWQAGPVGSGVFTNVINGGRISGATTYSLIISNLATTDTADYRVVVTGSAGSVTSAPPATLTVLPGSPAYRYTWVAPVAITTAGATLSQEGTIVGGQSFGSAETTVTLTDGTTIDFKPRGSASSVATVSGGGTAPSIGFTGDTGNGDFNAVLGAFTYTSGKQTITLQNLTVGQNYSVQLFCLDDRNGETTKTLNYQDPSDVYDVSATVAQGDNVYVIGTFTASNTTAVIQQNVLQPGDANINALVVRALSGTLVPQILTLPESATIYNGGTANLTVTAYGAGQLSYQWQAGPVGSGVFTNVINSGRISGATNNSLIINNLATTDTADYQVVVANSAGSVTSAPPATLTVLAGTPLFNWSPLVAITTADATLGLNGTIVGGQSFGSTETTVTLTDGTSIDFKPRGSASSVATVSGGGTGSGGFSGNTLNANFNAVLGTYSYGGTKTITLSNLTVGHQYSVQLFALDDRSGETTKTLNYQDPGNVYDISATFMEGDNVYIIGTFTATDTTAVIQQNVLKSGNANINALVVRALGGAIAPQISTQPQSATIYHGQTVSLNVFAYGTRPLSYQWQAGPVGSGVFTNVINGGRISGATTNSLIINNLATTDTADYRVVVVNSAGSAMSAPPATLTVLAGSSLYTWSTPVAITTADATLGLMGTIVGAQSFSPYETTVVLTDGTNIDFKNVTDGPVATSSSGGIGYGGFTGNTGNPAFDGILASYTYGSGEQTITLLNLIVGQPYSVQLFALDDRSGNTTRTINFQDPFDVSYRSATFAEGDNVYVIGTFTATSTNAVIQENLLASGGGNINALVVRTIVLSPTLSVSANAGTRSITLSWPVTASGFTMETSPVLGSNAVWTPVSGTAAIVGSNFQMTISTTNTAAFFRLQQ